MTAVELNTGREVEGDIVVVEGHRSRLFSVNIDDKMARSTRYVVAWAAKFAFDVGTF